MALEKLDQFFSWSAVRFNSVLIRSISASLLATICSAVSFGAPAWVNTWTGLPSFAAFELSLAVSLAESFAVSLAVLADFAPCLSAGAACPPLSFAGLVLLV